MTDETKGASDGAEIDEQEFESTEAEFRALFDECEETGEKLLKIANRMSARDADAADVLRQVANNVLPLIRSVISACGGAFAAYEEALAETEAGEGLNDDDAVDFYRAFTANLRLVDEAIAASDAGPQRTGLEALREMNQQMRDRVVELSDLEEEELADAAKKPPAEEAEADASN